jgi:hypothetical protein
LFKLQLMSHCAAVLPWYSLMEAAAAVEAPLRCEILEHRCHTSSVVALDGTHQDPPDLKLAQRVEDVTLVLASAIFSILSTLKSRLHGDYTIIYIKGRTLHEVETSAIREHLLSTWQSDTSLFRLTSSAGIELHIESIWSLSPTGGCVSFVSIS